MKPINISAPIVYKDRFEWDVDEQIKAADELFDMVEQYDVESALEEGGRSTADLFEILRPSEGYPHNMKVNAKYVTWLRRKMEYLRTAWRYDAYPHFISNSWYNEHYKWDYTEEHNHGVGLTCTASILKPEHSGDLWIYDPMTAVRAAEPISGNHPWRRINVTQGDVVFFPGWVRHKTGYNDTDNRRLTLTMNFAPDYKRFSNNPPIL